MCAMGRHRIQPHVFCWLDCDLSGAWMAEMNVRTNVLPISRHDNAITSPDRRGPTDLDTGVSLDAAQ